MEIKDLARDKMRVDLNCEVKSVSPIIRASNGIHSRQEILVADRTGEITLTIWDTHGKDFNSMAVGDKLHLVNCRTRKNPNGDFFEIIKGFKGEILIEKKNKVPKETPSDPWA